MGILSWLAGGTKEKVDPATIEGTAEWQKRTTENLMKLLEIDLRERECPNIYRMQILGFGRSPSPGYLAHLKSKLPEGEFLKRGIYVTGKTASTPEMDPRGIDTNGNPAAYAPFIYGFFYRGLYRNEIEPRWFFSTFPGYGAGIGRAGSTAEVTMLNDTYLQQHLDLDPSDRASLRRSDFDPWYMMRGVIIPDEGLQVVKCRERINGKMQDAYYVPDFMGVFPEEDFRIFAKAYREVPIPEMILIDPAEEKKQVYVDINARIEEQIALRYGADESDNEHNEGMNFNFLGEVETFDFESDYNKDNFEIDSSDAFEMNEELAM